ncbi:MAG: response regulator [Verrucomicrobiota bacterium]
MTPPFPFGRDNFDELTRRSQNHGARRVLLVDDEPEALYLFARMLVNAGIRQQIDVADSGEDALAYLERCLMGDLPWPAAVFLDIRMPMVDGFAVLAWAKEHGVLAHTTIVMLTSSEEPEDVSQAFELGAHYYIPKEAERDKLSDLLRDVLRSDERQSDAAAG